MHGNIVRMSDGLKTRYFDNIMSEVLVSQNIHHEKGSWLGGLHLEITAEDVTECCGWRCWCSGKSSEPQLSILLRSALELWPKSRVDAINDSIRNFKDAKGNQNFKAFKGIDTIEGQQQLFTGEGVNDTAGELRKAFVNRIKN